MSDEGRGFKDRRTWLVVFGVVMVLAGVVCAMFGLLTLATIWLMSTPVADRAVNTRALVPGIALYFGLAIVFVWLGIGSIMLRRWARTLLLIVSWLWLLTGVVGVAMMAFLLPVMLARSTPSGDALPEGFRIAMAIVVLGFLIPIMIILPGILVLFYRSPHVKATVEAADPVARWTDACPPAVLSLSLSLAFMSLVLLPQAAIGGAFLPVFGVMLTGAAGTMGALGLAALWGYCAWATYRMDPKGWWTTTVTMAVLTVSAAVTFARVDIVEIYRAMGYNGPQLDQLRDMMKPSLWLPFVAAMLVGVFGYLIYMKRYFRSEKT